jgi:hypothetical protein
MSGFEQYQAECWLFADGTTRHLKSRSPGVAERERKHATFRAVAALAAIALGGQFILPATASQSSITLGGIAREQQQLVPEYSLVPWPPAQYWNRQIARIEAWPKSDDESEPGPPPMF